MNGRTASWFSPSGDSPSKFSDERLLSRYYESLQKASLIHSKLAQAGSTLASPPFNHLKSSKDAILTEEIVNSVPVTDVNKTKIRKYPCGYPGCQWVFTRTNHVVRHHERVHPGFKPTKSTSNETEKASTETRKRPSTVLVCSQAGCKQIFSDPILLKNHIKLFHGSEQLPTLPDQSSHNSLHLETFNGLKLREALQGHHTCDFNGCGQRFSTKNELNFHLFQVHSIVEPEVCIKVEGQEWNDEEESDAFPTRKVDQPYTSDSLGYEQKYPSLSRSDILESKEDSLPGSSQLTRLEPSPRPYACSLPGCDKTYTKNSHLVRHLVETHKMSKPAPKVNRRMGLSFSPLSRMNVSLSTSLPSSTRGNLENYNERPYACNFPGCGWSFKRQYHLNRHIITHRMMASDSTNKHQKSWLDLENNNVDDSVDDSAFDLSLSHHDSIEDEPFSCDFPECGKVFIDSQKFVKHYLQHNVPRRTTSGYSIKLGDSVECSLEPPPVECVLQEFSDESDEISSSSNRMRGTGSAPFSKKVVIEIDDS